MRALRVRRDKGNTVGVASRSARRLCDGAGCVIASARRDGARRQRCPVRCWCRCRAWRCPVRCLVLVQAMALPDRCPRAGAGRGAAGSLPGAGAGRGAAGSLPGAGAGRGGPDLCKGRRAKKAFRTMRRFSSRLCCFGEKKSSKGAKIGTFAQKAAASRMRARPLLSPKPSLSALNKKRGVQGV